MRAKGLRLLASAFLLLLINQQVLAVAKAHEGGQGGRRLNGSGHKNRHRNAHEVNSQGNANQTNQAAQSSGVANDQQADAQAASLQQAHPQAHTVASSWSSGDSSKGDSHQTQQASEGSGSSGSATAASHQDPAQSAELTRYRSLLCVEFPADHVTAWSIIPKDPFTWDGEASWEWDNPKTLYFEPLSGLGNRLRALASAVVLAKEYGVGLKVIWREEPPSLASFNPGFNSTWSDLFTEPNLRLVDNFPGSIYQTDHEMDMLRAENRDEKVMPTLEAHQCGIYQPRSHADMVRFLQTGWKKLSTGEEVLCVRSDLWLTEQGEKEGKFFFRLLKPSPVVQSMIDKFKFETEWEENHMVGVHVRRGDLTIWGKNGDHSKVKTLIPIETYIEAMKGQKALAAGVRRVRFFLATDDAEAESQIKAAFKPGYVFSYPKHNLSRNAVQGIQEALVDVMLLADCPVLVGTYYSSYSETAKMMGWPFYIQVGWDLKRLSIETKIDKDDPEEEEEFMKKLL